MYVIYVLHLTSKSNNLNITVSCSANIFKQNLQLCAFSSAIFAYAALLSGIASCLKSTQVTTKASSIKWAEQVHIQECGAYFELEQ